MRPIRFQSLLSACFVLLTLLPDSGRCCPKKFQSLTEKVKDKFKLKSAKADAPPASSTKSGGASVDNPGCKNPFFPCNEGGGIVEAVAKTTKNTHHTRQKVFIATAAVGGGAAVGAAAVGLSGIGSSSDKGKTGKNAKELPQKEGGEGGGEDDSMGPSGGAKGYLGIGNAEESV